MLLLRRRRRRRRRPLPDSTERRSDQTVQPSSRPPAHGRCSRWAALSLRLSTSLSPWQRSPGAWHVMNQCPLLVSQRQLLHLPPHQARVQEPGCSLARVLVHKPAPHGWTPELCGPQRQLPAVWPPALQLPLPFSRQSFMLASLRPKRNGTAQGRAHPQGWSSQRHRLCGVPSGTRSKTCRTNGCCGWTKGTCSARASLRV